MLVAKKSVIAEINAFLKSLYLNRTGYPGHYRYRYYEPDGVSHGGSVGAEPKKKLGYTGKLRKELKDNLKGSFGFHINKKTGIKANLSGNSVDKMGSEKAIEKSKSNGFSVDDHFEVANKIVELYENAELTEISPDKKGSNNLESIKRFDSDVVLSNGRKARAHITVKESVQHGHKIYSVEVMELKKITASKKLAVGGEADNRTPTSNLTIPSTSESVKKSVLEKTRAKGQPKNRTVHASMTIPPVSESVKKSVLEQTKEILKAIGA